jgi:1-deoxy-D-xylulose-5-phosphate reductoisomerase
MGRSVKGLAVLGSTGSVGTQTLDVVRSFPDDFRVVALAARRSLDLLTEQVEEFRPSLVSCQGSHEEKAVLLSNGCVECAIEDMVRDGDVDLVVNAIVGDMGLDPTLAAVKAGKNVALANKEGVVMGGELLKTATEATNTQLLPIDSEPNAIWQCLRGEEEQVSRLIITASGGAFRNRAPEDLADVTPEEALNHPTWNMGPKITVDSATLMNKAFEVIEAHWLFGVPWEDIEVVIHHQSMIHSMVEFVDGSVKAHISPPDMRLPIQYALFYPDRLHNRELERFDPVKTGALTFEALVPERYPCFELALEYGKRGGTWPAVLCGADEMAVELFLDGRIGFLDIPVVITEALEAHEPTMKPSVDEITSTAAWARTRVSAAVRP